MGLSTKWRRSGFAGHFCTRVHAGCMAGCVRPRKLTLGELFCSFSRIHSGWYLQTISVFEELEKSGHRKSSARYFYFLRIDGSEQCRTQNNVQHCRASCTVTRTAVVGGKQHLRLRFVLPLFSLQKRFPHLAFWLFRVGFCCGSWLLSPSHGHLTSRASADLANSLRFMCSVQRKLCCSWSSALHRSTIKTDEKEVFLEVENSLGPLRS